MTKPIRMVEEAQAEMTEAALFLESQAANLGIGLLDAIEKASLAIQLHPTAWPVFHGEYRIKLLERFHYSLIYQETETEIIVFAVAHQHRRPCYWLSRVPVFIQPSCAKRNRRRK